MKNKSIFSICLSIVLGVVLGMNMSFGATKNTGEVNKIMVKSNLTSPSTAKKDYSNNYIEEVYQKYKQLVKWNKNYILVYLPRDEKEDFVWSQFKIWEKALNGTVVFEQILTENGADIAVHYANQFLGKKAGYTKLAFKDGEITHADLYIYEDILENPLKKYSVLHEIGHALGITSHSSNPADIMYSIMTSRQNGLSVRDINTVMTIYSLEDGSKISAVQINPENKSLCADVQKANYFVDNAQFEPAIKLYEKAIKDGNNVAESYYGLSRAYYSLEKFDKAYKYSQKAYNEDSQNKIYLYGYIKIAIDTKHHAELKKFLNKYMIEADDAITDRTVQSALIYLEREEMNKKN